MMMRIAPAMEEARKLMAVDINILNVHATIRDLQQTRLKILNAARPRFETQARLLEVELNPVVVLANDFNAKLKALIKDHFNLALKNPAVLIKALQVVNRECKMKARKRKTVSVIPQMDLELDGTEDSVPANSLDNELWLLDWTIVSDWIRKSSEKRFNAMFESCKEKNKYQLSKCIEKANEKLFDDLTHVYDELRPCFPSQVDIFKIYCQVYHKSLGTMFREWGTSSGTPDEVLELGGFILPMNRNYYVLGRIKMTLYHL
jgi:hypothetical protein